MFKKLRVQSRFLPIVLIEVIYHLRFTYKVPKKEIVKTLKAFLAPDWVLGDNKDAIIYALGFYQTSNIDMVDILLFTISKTQSCTIVSFDNDFKKLKRLDKQELPKVVTL